MNIEDLALNGGTFKVNFPYHWIGWLIWVIGLLITLFGFLSAVNDVQALIISAIGLVIMAFSSPGSLEGSLHKLSLIHI